MPVQQEISTMCTKISMEAIHITIITMEATICTLVEVITLVEVMVDTPVASMSALVDSPALVAEAIHLTLQATIVTIHLRRCQPALQAATQAIKMQRFTVTRTLKPTRMAAKGRAMQYFDQNNRM